MQTVGIRATTLTAFGAALGVGIGFGLQDIVKNFVAGLVILIERPFQVGDRIEIDGLSADVSEIRSRATLLKTNDDIHMIVPNSRFMTDTIVNRSYGRQRVRYRVSVGVGYRSAPREVEARSWPPRRGARACSVILLQRSGSRDSETPRSISSCSAGRNGSCTARRPSRAS